MPDWDNTESRESDEDAAWRDLVARFEEPATTTGPTPWPDRENVSGSRPPSARPTDGTAGAPGTHGAEGAHGADGAEEPPEDRGSRRTRADGEARGDRGTQGDPGAFEDTGARGDPGTGARGDPGAFGDAGARGDGGARGTRGGEGIRGFDDEGVRGTFDAGGQAGAGRPAAGGDGSPGAHEPDVIQAARRERRAPAHGTRARRIRARKAPPPPEPDDEEHFIPPAPPALPKLDPVTKGAWLALFGGPAYLVAATAANWSVSGIAAFCAVAAFVAGFAILVLHMHDSSGPDGPEDGDDGAVV